MRSFVPLALTFALLVCPLLCGPQCASSGPAQVEAAAPARTCCAKCRAREKASSSERRGERPDVSAPARPAEPDDHDECRLDCLCKGAVKNGTVAVESPPQIDPPAVNDSLSALLTVASLVRRDRGPPGRPPDGRTLRLAISSLRC